MTSAASDVISVPSVVYAHPCQLTPPPSANPVLGGPEGWFRLCNFNNSEYFWTRGNVILEFGELNDIFKFDDPILKNGSAKGK